MAPEWALVASDQVVVHLNTVGRSGLQASFDHNRVFVGINRTLSNYVDMNVGYPNPFLNTRLIPDLANQMNHMVVL
jgi:hypothetical protein